MTSRRNTIHPEYSDKKCTKYTQLFWPIHEWDECAKVQTHEMLECPGHSDVVKSPQCFKQVADDKNVVSVPKDDIWNPPRSKLFWTAFRASHEAYFTDRYFEKENIHSVVVEETLRVHRDSGRTPQSIVIFLESRRCDELKSRMAKMLNDGGVMRCHVEVLIFPENYQIHDRFALFDDNIWHCGATVGGVHGAFHAISGPWNDIDGKMKTLFNKMRAAANR